MTVLRRRCESSPATARPRRDARTTGDFRPVNAARANGGTRGRKWRGRDPCGPATCRIVGKMCLPGRFATFNPVAAGIPKPVNCRLSAS
jgi:hypothetical protein